MKEIESTTFNKKKIITIALAVICIAGITAYGYVNSSKYSPESTEKSINANHVVFPEDEQTNKMSNNNGENSDLWEQNHRSNDRLKPNQLPGSSVLMEASANNGNGNGNNSQDGTGAGGIAVSPGGDGDSPVVVVPGDGDGDGGGGNGDNGNDNGNGNGNGDGDNEDHTPITSDLDLERQPPKSSLSEMQDNIDDVPEGGLEKPDDMPADAEICAAFFATGQYENALYYGQKLDEEIILCATEAYAWYGTDPEFDYFDPFIAKYRISNKNIRVKTEETPIPKVVEGPFELKFQWRETEKSPWRDYYTLRFGEAFDTVSYEPNYAKVVVGDYGKNKFVKILCQPAEKAELPLNLYICYKDMFPKVKLKDEPYIDQLFLGWSEKPNGKPVNSLFVIPKSGRYVLYPLKKVKLGKDYKVRLMKKRISDYVDVNEYQESYIQILTGYTGKKSGLNIPEGVQIVDFTQDKGKKSDTGENGKITYVDKMSIPDSVISVNLGTFGKLIANYQYNVSEGNSLYSSENGILLNKEMTKVLGVPYKAQSVTFSNIVEEIDAEISENVKSIHMTSENAPVLDPALLQGNGGKIYVPDEYMHRYVEQWSDIKVGLDAKGWKLCKESSEDPYDYQVDNGFIVTPYNDPDTLSGVFKSKGGEATLPDYIKYIKSGAFDGCDEITGIIINDGAEKIETEGLSGSGAELIEFTGNKVPEFNKDSFGDVSEKENYIKVPQDSYDDYLAAFTEVFGSDTAKRLIYSTEIIEKGNFIYEFSSETEELTLIGVKDKEALTVVTEETFDTPDGKPLKAIGKKAFDGCINMKFIELPASVKKIGEDAFNNCPNVETIVSMSESTITIGNRAFDGTAENSYGIALNAKKAYFMDGYEIDTGCFFVYVPSDGEGYSDDYIKWYQSYYAEEVKGQKGQFLIYGRNEGTDDVYLVASTKGIEGVLDLNPMTYTIEYAALQNCYKLTGINEETMTNLYGMGNYVFLNSDIKNFTVPKSVQVLNMYTFSEMTMDTLTFEPDSVRTYVDDMSGFNGLTVNNIILSDTIDTVWDEFLTNCNLKGKVVFTSREIPELIAYKPFEFGCELDGKTTKVSLEGAAEGKELDYIFAWRGAVAAFTGIDESQLEARELLDAENKLRTVMGLETVEKPSTVPDYILSDDGMVLKRVDSSVEHAVIPEGVTTIKGDAFKGCSNLEDIVMPSTLITMDSDLFQPCTNLKKITFTSGTVPEIGMNELLMSSFGFSTDGSVKFVLDGDAKGKEEEYLEGMYTYLVGYHPLIAEFLADPEELEAAREVMKKMLGMTSEEEI